MKNARMLMLAAAMTLLLVPTGCNKPSPSEVQSITGGVVQLGFSVWAQSNPTQEAAVAKQVDAGAAIALDYLKNNAGVATTVLDATVQAKLVEGLPPEVQALIISAAGILDTVLPAPGPDTFMTADQLAYLVAFIQGVKDGVDAVGTKAMVKNLEKAQKAQKSLRPGKWFRNKIAPAAPAPIAPVAPPSK